MARRLQSRIHPLEQADSGHTTRYREEQVGYGTAASPPPRNTVQETRRITLSPCERTTRGVRRGSGHGRMTCSPRYADPPATPSHGREGQTSPANAPPSNGQRKPLCRHRPSRLAWVETGARRRWACARTSTRICRRRSTWREHDAHPTTIRARAVDDPTQNQQPPAPHEMHTPTRYNSARNGIDSEKCASTRPTNNRRPRNIEAQVPSPRRRQRADAGEASRAGRGTSRHVTGERCPDGILRNVPQGL